MDQKWNERSATPFREEKSAVHIMCCLQLEMFGKIDIGQQLDDGYRMTIRRHNQQVDKNRHVFGTIIDCIRFCGEYKLARRGQ